jgi:hypothetical protein
MKISKLLASALILGLCLLVVAPASAQTNQRKKEFKKVLKTLPADVETVLIDFANSKLKDKEEGVAITDAKTLKKHFSLLSPTDQADVLTYAKRMADGAPAVAMEHPTGAPAPQKIAANPTPQPVKLKPAPNTMVQPAPSETAQPTQPAQPAYIEKANSMPKTTVQWYEEMHEFGNITQGDVVTHVFKFKNTGSSDLLLTRVKASCGCTTPSWSNEPIAPGQEGMIKVSFNSTGKMGPQVKTVTVTHNGEPIHHVLRFKGTVVAKPAGGN